jgi:hypothetical protein
MIICLQCAMEAMVRGQEYNGERDQTIEAHQARMHPDLQVTQARRRELEEILEARIVTGQALLHAADDEDQS